MDNVIVRVVDLPLCVKGVTVPHPDGSYNIFINAHYSIEEQKKTLKHELRHVRCCDFDSLECIELIERRANT